MKKKESKLKTEIKREIEMCFFLYIYILDYASFSVLSHQFNTDRQTDRDTHIVALLLKIKESGENCTLHIIFNVL